MCFFLFIFINTIRIPAEEIEIKIFYDAPKTDVAQLFWTNSENEYYNGDFVYSEEIKKGSCTFSIAKEDFDMKKVRIDFVSENCDFKIKKIEFRISGLPFKTIRAGELKKYIENIYNIQDLRAEGDSLEFCGENGDPQVEMKSSFQECIISGFNYR